MGSEALRAMRLSAFEFWRVRISDWMVRSGMTWSRDFATSVRLFFSFRNLEDQHELLGYLPTQTQSRQKTRPLFLSERVFCLESKDWTMPRDRWMLLGSGMWSTV